MMKFFEWASFLLASVVSGSDVPALFNSVETLSAPKIAIEKQEALFTEKNDITNILRGDILKKQSFNEEEKKLDEIINQKPLEPGVTLHIPENSSLVVEEQVEIRLGDKFAAVIVDPVSGEIFSQSEWVEVKK